MRPDSAQSMPKCRVIDPSSYDWQGTRSRGLPGRTRLPRDPRKGFTSSTPPFPRAARILSEVIENYEVVDYIRNLGCHVRRVSRPLVSDDAHLLDKGLKTIGDTIPQASRANCLLLRPEGHCWLPGHGPRS